MEYFNRLPRERRDAPDIAASYDTSRRVLAVDPILAGLPAKVKARRAADDLVTAQARLQNCARQNGESLQETPPRTKLQVFWAQLQRMQIDWSQSSLERYPERLDAAMDFVFAVESAAAASCGEPQGDDRALWLLGRSGSVMNR